MAARDTESGGQNHGSMAARDTESEGQNNGSQGYGERGTEPWQPRIRRARDRTMAAGIRRVGESVRRLKIDVRDGTWYGY